MKKHILFVDDEPNILQGLKRTLRQQRHEWDMSFAEGGVQALVLLAEKPYDAVVTDMRMPGMDGAQLLNKVKSRYPDIVRFVLSGYSDQEMVMRSVGPSHQYMAKPCDPELLKTNLTGAFALRKLLMSDDLRGIVMNMTSLPSLPTIYCAVVEELQSTEVSLVSVGKLIEQDLGMTSKVIQLVNSAYFGIGRNVTSPAEAANFLGLDVLKSLVLAEGVFSQFDPAVVKALSLDAVKNRSLRVAKAARMIAKSENADAKIIEQAFLAGLLHEMGSMVLAANAPDNYLRACKLLKQGEMDIWCAEKQIFNTTHAEIGAYVLGLWGIDIDVVTAIAYHHNPAQFPDVKFSALTAVYVASTCLSITTETTGNYSSEQALFTEEGMAYLDNIGMTEHLPDWLALCSASEEDAA